MANLLGRLSDLGVPGTYCDKLLFHLRNVSDTLKKTVVEAIVAYCKQTGINPTTRVVIIIVHLAMLTDQQKEYALIKLEALAKQNTPIDVSLEMNRLEALAREIEETRTDLVTIDDKNGKALKPGDYVKERVDSFSTIGTIKNVGSNGTITTSNNRELCYRRAGDVEVLTNNNVVNYFKVLAAKPNLTGLCDALDWDKKAALKDALNLCTYISRGHDLELRTIYDNAIVAMQGTRRTTSSRPS